MSLVTPEVVIRSAVFNNLRKKDKKNRKVRCGVCEIFYLAGCGSLS